VVVGTGVDPVTSRFSGALPAVFGDRGQESAEAKSAAQRPFVSCPFETTLGRR